MDSKNVPELQTKLKGVDHKTKDKNKFEKEIHKINKYAQFPKNYR